MLATLKSASVWQIMHYQVSGCAGMYTKEALQRARVAIQQAGATQQGDRTVQQGGGTTQQGGVVVQQRGVIIQKGDGAIQLGSVTVQQAGTRRRPFADTDAAVMPPAKLQRLSTVTVAQVGSCPCHACCNAASKASCGEELKRWGAYVLVPCLSRCHCPFRGGGGGRKGVHRADDRSVTLDMQHL